LPLTTVTTERGDSWALLTLSSPAGLNKLGTDTLISLLKEIRANLSYGCRCLGITGEGDSFAVGADLREIGGLTPATARQFSDLGNSIFRLLENSDTIIVAGIDGFCLGGGLDLALAADWRIATSRSVFGHPGADLGLITGFGGTQRLPRLIGASRAVNWLYTAERISASDAYSAGLLQEISSEGDFQEALMKRIRTFAGLSSEWVRDVKRKFRYQCNGWPEGGRTSVSIG
jgi:enoyl-CoA hydratase